MYAESLGRHAAQGHFNLVSILVTEGRYLPAPETKKATHLDNGGRFFRNIKEQFFDRTEVDIAVMEEIRKAHRRVHASTTVEGIIELASTMALNHENVVDTVLGKDDQESRLEKLLNYEVPSQMEWESEVEGQPYPLPLFIKKAIPFLRTRKWLHERYERMRQAETDRFIASIKISRRPALVAVS